MNDIYQGIFMVAEALITGLMNYLIYTILIIAGLIIAGIILHWLYKKIKFIWYYRILHPEKGKQLDALRGKK